MHIPGKDLQLLRVIDWTDYTHRYGFGYVLNNGYTGVTFNDQTRFLVNPVEKKALYVQRSGADKMDLLQTFDQDKIPEELNPKYVLLLNFMETFKEWGSSV